MAKTSDIFRNIFYGFLILSLAQPIFNGMKDLYKKNVEPHTQIGYLEIKGMILDSSYYVKQLHKFFKDDEIKGIMIKIDSNGGVAASSEIIFNELITLKKEYPKPVISLIENICASGSYWIASATDHIIASPVSWVGSIGASIPFQFKLKDFLAQHQIRYETTTTGNFKSTTDPFVDATPEQKAMLQSLCDQTYVEFSTSIARQRSKLSIKEINLWADGQIFTGKQGYTLGLVDELGSKSNAISWLKEKVPVEDRIEWVKPEKISPLSRWLGGDTSNSDVSFISTVNHLVSRLFAPRNNISALESQGAV